MIDPRLPFAVQRHNSIINKKITRTAENNDVYANEQMDLEPRDFMKTSLYIEFNN